MIRVDGTPAHPEEMVEVSAAALLPPIEDIDESGTATPGEGHEVLWLPRDGGSHDTTAVLVHRTAVLGTDIQVGNARGPIGRGTVVGDSVRLHGALFSNVTVHDRAKIGEKAHLGNVGEEAVGKIVVGRAAVIGANVRVYSPIVGDTTKIGEEAHIGKGVRIGVNNVKKGFTPKAVEVGARALIANGTIVRAGVTIGEGSEIPEGYEIANGVKIPSGVRLLRFPKSYTGERVNGRMLVTKTWERQLRGFYEEIK